MLKKVIVSIFFCVVACETTIATAQESYIIKLSDEYKNVGYLNELNETDPLLSHGIITVGSEDELRAYIDSGLVEYYEPDYEVELFADDYSDELYGGQWYHSKINSSYAWDLSTYGNEVKIGVIDSGCYEHTDIVSNLLEGFDFANATKDTSDNIGHGTHVSGIIAGSMNGEGIIGIANMAKIVPLKCFDTGKTTKVSVISAAILAAVDTYNCDVINMSWGIASDSETLRNAINYAHENGVLMVAAVGNKGTDVLYYPAAYDCVIGVGAVDSKLTLCDFSQHNESVFVVAPGRNILSLGTSNDNYLTMNGTSQSAPMVTAMISLMLNIDSTLTIESVKECLKNSADDLGTVGYDTSYGYGLINIKKLMQYMLRDVKYYVSPISISGSVAEVLVYNNTSDNLECSLIYGKYNDATFGECELFTVSLDENQYNKYVLGKSNGYNLVKCFLWSDINMLTPLSQCRNLRIIEGGSE